MKRSTGMILAAVLAAVVGHTVTVWQMPAIVMNEAYKVLTGNGQLVNGYSHAPRQTPETRDLGRPAPEIAYSSCAYDLSEGPVRITTPAWRHYYSIAFYDDRAGNFFTMNDSQLSGEASIFVLGREAPAAAPPKGARYVQSPSTRGAILVRRLVETRDEWPEIAQLRQSETCEPMENAR
tara:strand:+ start:2608 stop:3144 length:537 start_codon:yes stop_codon:yes gene_type:complete